MSERLSAALDTLAPRTDSPSISATMWAMFYAAYCGSIIIPSTQNPGQNPVSFSRAQLVKLCESPDRVRRLVVCEKTDGIRGTLFLATVDGVRTAFVVPRYTDTIRVVVFGDELRPPAALFDDGGSVLEVEVLVTPDRQHIVLTPFDVLMVMGESLMHYIVEDRLATMSAFQASDLAPLARAPSGTAVICRTKAFLPVRQIGRLRDRFERARRLADDDDVWPAVDGLILTPLDDEVGSGANYDILKFKFTHSVDFVAGFSVCGCTACLDGGVDVTWRRATDGRPHLQQGVLIDLEYTPDGNGSASAKRTSGRSFQLHAVRSVFAHADGRSDLLFNGQPVWFSLEATARTALVVDTMRQEGHAQLRCVVECTVDLTRRPAGDGWAVACSIIRIRDDKTVPNVERTVLKTLENVHENVSFDELERAFTAVA
jgi:hypothetical protein